MNSRLKHRTSMISTMAPAWLVIIVVVAWTFSLPEAVQSFDRPSQLLCAYSRQSTVKIYRVGGVPAVSYKESSNGLDEDARHGGGSSAEQNMATGELLDSNTTERCPRNSHFCYSLWQEDPVNKTIIVVTQGCWGTSGEVDCQSSNCTSTKKPSKVLNNTMFCCCLGDFCNVNVTDGYVPSDDDNTEIDLPEQLRAEQGNQTIVVIVVVCALVTVFFAAVALVAYRCMVIPRFKPGLDSAHLMEAPQMQSPTLDLDSLKMQEMIGKGRYGTVCKGSLNDRTVAVKIFAQHHHLYYANEKDIYKLFRMDYPFLPRLIGADERVGPEGRREWLLVLTYAPRGSLQSQLRKGTTDWAGLCRMAQSITRALAFLHGEEKNKPCIAHRDLTSQNVLVKDDGSCMLCDFGFAIRISGSKYIRNGEEQHAETNSLAEVGTLRYMAPEVLEGALNLRDCESSLKQVDVYALGLILWEIATRCSDLYQGMNVPEYKMPYEAEVGVHPSTEQMQVLVARHKARPLFPDIWKASNPAVRALKETIEDCWDQDAEARLTAVCVEERLNELPMLWDRHKAGISVTGVSPTINPTSAHHHPRSGFSSLLGCGPLGPCSIQNSTERSEATAETPLSPSSPGVRQPADKNSTAANNHHNRSNLAPTAVSVPLQPHQGRNPCLERNLMVEPVEEISVSGNTLLDQDSRSLLPYAALLGGVSMGNRLVGNGLGSNGLGSNGLLSNGLLSNGLLSNGLVSNGLVSNGLVANGLVANRPASSGLVGNADSSLSSPATSSATAATTAEDNSALVLGDVLAQTTRAYHPIPYVQNAVHVSTVIPKQPNLPGNGHKILGLPKKAEKKRFRGMFWKPKASPAAEGGLRWGLRNLFEWRPREDAGRAGNAKSDNTTPPEKFPVNTEVQMVEGSCRVRSLPPVTPVAENETSPLLQSKDINDNCRETEEDRVSRPTTLPLRMCLPVSKGSAADDGSKELSAGLQRVCIEDA
ncbi:unnamed protein product [Ixodes pacificus]